MSNRDVNLVGVNRGESTDYTRVSGSLGIQKLFPNGTGAFPDVIRDQRDVLMELVRNSSGGAILPGQVVTYKTLLSGKEITNPAAAATGRADGIADHYLPAAGVADGRCFWMVIDGPTKFLNDAAGAISEFDELVVSASVAGCVRTQTAAPTQGNEVPQLNGKVGRAEAAAVAGGGTLANATAFFGYFRAPK